MIRKAFYVWFSISGSINRATFLLYYVIPIIILFVILWIISFSFGTPGPGEEPGIVDYEITPENNIIAFLVSTILFFILLVGMTWGLFASGIKRLHNMEKSGWWMLVMLTPLGFILFLVLIFARGGGWSPPPRRVD